MRSESRCNLLHIEDDPDDAFLLGWAVRRTCPWCELRHLTDGEAALAYLQQLDRDAPDPSRPWPDLLLLDVNLPGISGWEVLQWIRAKPRFKTLPIIVLSGSLLPKDQARAEQLGADGFFEKTALGLDIAAYVAEHFGPGQHSSPLPAALMPAARAAEPAPAAVSIAG